MAESRPAPALWGDPTPWGFAALAGICLVFAGDFLGWWDPGNVPLLFALGIPAGVCQLGTAIILLRNGNAIAGNAFGAFSMLFMWAPVLMVLTHVLGWAPTLDPLFGGWNVFLGVLLIVWLIGICRAPWIEFLGIALIGVALVLAGLHHLIGLSPAPAGWLLLIGGFWGFYMTAHGLGVAARIHVPLGGIVAPIK